MHDILRVGEKQKQALPSPVSSLAAMRMESHLVSYPMQYRVFPKIQATALLMRGALKLELVHTLYPAEPSQDGLNCMQGFEFGLWPGQDISQSITANDLELYYQHHCTQLP